MKTSTAWLPRFTAAVAGLSGLLLVGAPATAQTTGFPESGDGIVPIEYDGNTSCQDIGFTFGFKIEGNGAAVYTGTFPFDLSNGGSHTGGAPDDPSNSVTLSSDGFYLDWTATLGIDAVIMKGGQDSNAYVYIPEDTSDTGLASPALDNGSLPEISHVEFCYDYELDVEKTAEASYDRTVEWTLEKSVDIASHSGNAGEDAGNSTWTVVATKTETLDNYSVTGSITIANPAPFAVDYSVADSMDGVTAAVNCSNYTVAANSSVTCSYEATDVDNGVTGEETLNTATVTSETAGVAGGVATAPISFTENLIGYDEGTLSDARFSYSQSISGDTTENFPETFTCPSDASLYANGSYEFTETNTAILNGNINLSDSADVTVNCTLLPLEVSKTAAGSYDRTVTWTLEKSVDPASHTGDAGETAGSSTWTVVATKNETIGNYEVTGEISITNPAAIPQTFSVSDTLDDGTPVTVSCPSNTVVAGGIVKCSYAASPADDSATLNTATVTAPGNADQTATAPVTFIENLIGYDSGTLSDARFDYSQSISGNKTQTFAETFTCPADASLYTNGSYTFTETNTAVLNDSIDLTASATVEVTCTLPALVPSKDAAGSYDRTVTWTLEKSVDPASHGPVFAGETAGSSTWTVVADKTEMSDNYQVTGSISVYNPAAIAQTFSVSDVLNDGTGATVNCPSSTVAAGGTVNCSYTASPADGSATLNSATVTAPGNADQTATAPVSFLETLIGYDSGTLSDARFGYSNTISGDTTVPFPETFTCPSDEALYGEDGVYTFTETNTAILDDNINLEASAEVTVTCYLPAKAQVVKSTTEGDEDIGVFPFTFELYDPDGALVDTQTLGTGGGTVSFGADLKAEGTWTVVELLPAGWVSTTDTSCTFDVTFPGSADQTYTCSFDNVEMSRVDLLKLTNGVETTDQAWSFAIYEGPDGFGGTEVASDSTPPALLDFDLTDLNPLATYTLCEKEVPAGYSSFWQVDADGDGIVDTTVVPYNPNADDDPPEDLGNRCVEIGVDPDGEEGPIVSIQLDPGLTLHFEVDNQQPGGAPRTPGYWKNWNTCTGGGQQYTAEANGGWEEGFWLLEDVLDPAIGGGIVWDDILVDELVVPITSCEVAVDILDKRLVGNPDEVADDRKVASDPLHNLATHLLAAHLNFGAGACTTQEVLDAALAAETLLDQYNFDGNSHDKLDKKSDDVGLANSLATYLDEYNNGMYCGDGVE